VTDDVTVSRQRRHSPTSGRISAGKPAAAETSYVIGADISQRDNMMPTRNVLSTQHSSSTSSVIAAGKHCMSWAKDTVKNYTAGYRYRWQQRCLPCLRPFNELLSGWWKNECLCTFYVFLGNHRDTNTQTYVRDINQIQIGMSWHQNNPNNLTDIHGERTIGGKDERNRQEAETTAALFNSQYWTKTWINRYRKVKPFRISLQPETIEMLEVTSGTVRGQKYMYGRKSGKLAKSGFLD